MSPDWSKRMIAKEGHLFKDAACREFRGPLRDMKSFVFTRTKTSDV